MPSQGLRLLVLVLALTSTASAQKRSAGSGAWEDPARWVPAGVPTAAEDVRILAGHRVTLAGARRVGSLTLDAGATLAGAGPGVSIWLELDGDLVNRGTLSGGDAAGSPDPGLTGGHVILIAAGSVDNHGVIEAGRGGFDAPGGMVRIHCAGNLCNREGAAIGGGGGGPGVLEEAGEGGMIDAVAAGELENHGWIAGGPGGESRTPWAGSGGFVYLEGKRGLLVTGSVLGGQSDRAILGDPDPGGAVMAVGRIVRLEGRRAAVIGSSVSLQADGGPIALHDLGGGAIQANGGPLVLLASGEVDLTANLPLTVQRIYGFSGLLVLADDVRLDPGVRVEDLIAPAPVLRRRARVVPATGATPGGLLRQSIEAPDDAGRHYHAASAWSRRFGIIVDAFGVVPVDQDPLFRLSVRDLPPFSGYAGTLDEEGRATIALRVPAVASLAGVAVFTSALVFDAGGVRNLASASRVIIGP